MCNLSQFCEREALYNCASCGASICKWHDEFSLCRAPFFHRREGESRRVYKPKTMYDPTRSHARTPTRTMMTRGQVRQLLLDGKGILAATAISGMSRRQVQIISLEINESKHA